MGAAFGAAAAADHVVHVSGGERMSKFRGEEKAMRRNRELVSVCAAAVASALVASQLQAAELQWKGGTGAIGATNYTSDGTNSLAPTTSDFVNIGAGGSVTSSANFNVPGRARIGHNFAFTSPTFAGSATLTVSGGTLTLGGNGAQGVPGAGMVIGYNADGLVNLTG